MTTINIRIYKCTGKTGRCNSFFLQDTITCSRPELKTYCVLFNNFLKIPVFWRNASETPRDRWHYEANAGLPACVAILLWGKRSGLVAESGPPSFPGVSNGRHRKPYLSRSSIWPGHICPGQDICGRNHTKARTKITRAASNRALYAEYKSFVPTARASRKNKIKINLFKNTVPTLYTNF